MVFWRRAVLLCFVSFLVRVRLGSFFSFWSSSIADFNERLYKARHEDEVYNGQAIPPRQGIENTSGRRIARADAPIIPFI